MGMCYKLTNEYPNNFPFWFTSIIPMNMEIHRLVYMSLRNQCNTAFQKSNILILKFSQPLKSK